jgi:5-methylcytosine-specific restriction endonuclease McrA
MRNLQMAKLYPKYDPGTYYSRELFRTVCETNDLRPVWAWKNSQKWSVDYERFLAKCGETCACCGSPLNYGLGKNNVDKLDIHTPSTDHIRPRSVGGTNDLDNLRIICNRCNLLKNNSTPEDVHRYRRILETLEKYDTNSQH